MSRRPDRRLRAFIIFSFYGNLIPAQISLPPDIAQEYEKIAKMKGETKSQLFREIFVFYRQERLEDEFFRI